MLRGDQYNRTVVCVAVDIPFAAPGRSRKWVLGFLSQRSRFLFSKSLSMCYYLVLFSIFYYMAISISTKNVGNMYILYIIVQKQKPIFWFLLNSHLKPSAWKLSLSQSRRQLLGLSVRTRVQLRCMLKMETRIEKGGRDMWRYLSALRFLASAQDCVLVTTLYHLPHMHCSQTKLLLRVVCLFSLLPPDPPAFGLWYSLQCCAPSFHKDCNSTSCISCSFFFVCVCVAYH